MMLLLAAKALGFIKAHPRAVAIVLTIAACLVVSVSGAHYLARLLADGKRTESDSRIEKLNQEVETHKSAAAAALARADEIERILETERTDHQRIVGELVGLVEQRKQEGTRYVDKRQALDRVTDFDELRRLDCELRARLGYDCAESAPPRGTADRPDGPRARTPPQ